MAVPTVPGSEFPINTPRRTATLDAGAFQLNPAAFQIDPGAATAPARATLAAVDATFRGKKAVAGSLENVGGALEGIAQDMLKVQRTQIAADADFRMREAQQSFFESLKGDGNEATWTQRAKETSDRVTGEILDAHNVPPGMRPELTAAMRQWGQGLQIKTSEMALLQKINRAEVAVRSSYDAAGRGGDAQGMANAVALGRSSKLDPVEMDRLEAGIPRALALTAIENGLQVNPAGTSKLLDSGASLPVADQHGTAINPATVLTPNELQSWRVKARSETSAWQSRNYETLLETADPTTGLISESAIREAMDSDSIRTQSGNALLQAQQRRLLEQQKAQAALLHTDIKDPTAWDDDPDATAQGLIEKANATIQDKTLRQKEIDQINTTLRAVKAANVREQAKTDRTEYNMIAARNLNRDGWLAAPNEYEASLIDQTAAIGDPALRQRAINEIKKQKEAIKKTGEIAQRPVERQIMSQIEEDRRNTGFSVPLASQTKTHWFKPNEVMQVRIEGGLKGLRDMTDAEVEKKFGKGVTRGDVLEAEQLHYNQMVEKMRAWFKDPANANATYEQANTYRRELERPFVMGAARQALSKQQPISISTKQQFDALPSGTPFLWNGRLGTKN